MYGAGIHCSGSSRSTRAASFLLGALVAAIGCVSAPAFAGPHVPFSVSGTITMIDTGDVKPAGQSGRFIVETGISPVLSRALSALRS